LHDLQRGKVADLLKPRKVARRPQDPTAKEAFRALAAVAMDLLMQGKVPRKRAAQQVARTLSRMGYQQGSGGTISAQHVEDWRDRMSIERPVEYEPAARFHRLREHLQAGYPEDPVGAAHFLMSRISLVVPPDNPKKPPT
jgi:hypothetical protein